MTREEFLQVLIDTNKKWSAYDFANNFGGTAEEIAGIFNTINNTRPIWLTGKQVSAPYYILNIGITPGYKEEIIKFLRKGGFDYLEKMEIEAEEDAYNRAKLVKAQLADIKSAKITGWIAISISLASLIVTILLAVLKKG